MKKIAVLSVVIFCISGCALLDFVQQRIAVKNCTFDFVEAVPKSFSLTAVNLDIRIKAANPNQIDVVIDKLDLLLYLNDRKTVTAKFSGINIAPGRSRTLTTTLEIPYLTAGMAVIDLLKSKKPVRYRLEGEVYINTSLGTFSFPVTIYESK